MTAASQSNLPVVGDAAGKRAMRMKSALGLWVARVLLLVGVLTLWQITAATGLVDPAFVGTPLTVAAALAGLLGSGEIWLHLRTTLIEVGIAFVASVVLGMLAAVLLDRAKGLHSLLAPYLTAINSMPRIALGPLFILWFGIGLISKIILAFSLGFFIMLLSTLGGLRNVDRDLLLMSRLFGASESRLFWHVRLPWALPGVFAGLKLTLIYCTGGAVIGEMIAAQSGLGLLIQTFSGQFDIASLLAVMVILVVVVMLLTGVLDFLERRLLSWSKGSTDVPG